MPPNEYRIEEDPKLFHSTKTQRGPLSENWIEEHKQQLAPLMCAYKLCKVEFRYWGMQAKIERFIHDTGEPAPGPRPRLPAPPLPGPAHGPACLPLSAMPAARPAVLHPHPEARLRLPYFVRATWKHLSSTHRPQTVCREAWSPASPKLLTSLCLKHAASTPSVGTALGAASLLLSGPS